MCGRSCNWMCSRCTEIRPKFGRNPVESWSNCGPMSAPSRHPLQQYKGMAEVLMNHATSIYTRHPCASECIPGTPACCCAHARGHDLIIVAYACEIWPIFDQFSIVLPYQFLVEFRPIFGSLGGETCPPHPHTQCRLCWSTLVWLLLGMVRLSCPPASPC